MLSDVSHPHKTSIPKPIKPLTFFLGSPSSALKMRSSSSSSSPPLHILTTASSAAAARLPAKLSQKADTASVRATGTSRTEPFMSTLKTADG